MSSGEDNKPDFNVPNSTSYLMVPCPSGRDLVIISQLVPITDEERLRDNTPTTNSDGVYYHLGICNKQQYRCRHTGEAKNAVRNEIFLQDDKTGQRVSLKGFDVKIKNPKLVYRDRTTNEVSTNVIQGQGTLVEKPRDRYYTPDGAGVVLYCDIKGVTSKQPGKPYWAICVDVVCRVDGEEVGGQIVSTPICVGTSFGKSRVNKVSISGKQTQYHSRIGLPGVNMPNADQYAALQLLKRMSA